MAREPADNDKMSDVVVEAASGSSGYSAAQEIDGPGKTKMRQLHAAEAKISGAPSRGSNCCLKIVMIFKITSKIIQDYTDSMFWFGDVCKQLRCLIQFVHHGLWRSTFDLDVY